MAEGLATLVRVNEWAVDNKRRELGVLLRELNELVDKLSYLEHEVVVEQDTATNDPEEAGFLYGVYAEGVIQRRQNFDAAIRDKEAEINVARESLNEAYRTLKKFEVVLKSKKRILCAPPAPPEGLYLSRVIY